MAARLDTYSRNDLGGQRSAAARRTLDVWAACMRHAQAGGTGYPTIQEVFAQDVSERTVLVSELAGKAESDRIIDASRRKYQTSPSLVRIPVASLDCIVTVEAALTRLRAEPWFRQYLTVAYPERGAFAPADSYRDTERFIVEWAGLAASKSSCLRNFRNAMRGMATAVVCDVQDSLDGRRDLGEFLV